MITIMIVTFECKMNTCSSVKQLGWYSPHLQMIWVFNLQLALQADLISVMPNSLHSNTSKKVV